MPRQEVIGKRRYCRECDFFTRNANTLSMHVSRTHRQGHIECTKCDDLFTTKGTLFHHMLSKHTDKTIECSFETCTHQFKTETNHRIHFIRKHTKIEEFMMPVENTNEFKCIECGKRGGANTIVYHVILCSPLSPFSPKAVQDPLDDLEMLAELEENVDFFHAEETLVDLEMLDDLENGAFCLEVNVAERDLPINVFDEEIEEFLLECTN